MVLPDARMELRDALADLIAGRMSGNDFDEFYERVCLLSSDRAVEAIGEFADGL